MRGLLAISAVLASAAAAAPNAFAAATSRIPAASLNGPVVAGGEAVWATARRDEGFNLVAARPGGASHRVRRFPSYQDASGHYAYLVPQLSSAGARIGLAIDAGPIPFDRYDTDLGPVGADVLTGPPDGPLESVLQCRPGLPVQTTAAVTADGIVLPGPDCASAQAGGLALRGAGGDVRPLTPSGGRPRSAGRFVGWISHNGDVVVYDTVASAVSYRITGLQRIVDWDLQADGKVVFAALAADGTHATLDWASPDDPSSHEIPIPAATNWDVHLSGDRIAYLRANTGSAGFYFGELGVTDLTGHARTIASRAIGVAASHPAFDFDGSNVTWTAPACRGATLHSQSIDEPPLLGPRPRCALSFRLPARMVGTTAIRVSPRCTGFVLPNCGDSNVTLDSAKGHVRLGSDLTRYCDLSADITLTRRGRALVRKSKRLQVRATVTAFDAGGHQEIRRGTFTLRTHNRATHQYSCDDDY
jgi:hypothetical protein